MFGNRLRELRKSKGLTMKELGKKFSLAESTISGYENGNRKPDLEMINAFADFFEVSSDYLLGRTDKNTITVAGEEIDLTEEELKVFEEIKKYPIAFHDLQRDPGPKVKQLIKMWEAMKVQFEEIDKEEK